MPGLFAVLVFILISAANAPAYSEPKSLHVGLLEIPPYAINRGDGTIHGLFVDIFQKFLKDNEWNITLAAYPTARLKRYMQNGSVDCTIYIRTPATEEVAEPIVYLGVDFNSAVIAKKPTQISKYEDLKKLRLGVARGTIFGHKIDTDNEINKLITRDYRQSAIMLSRNRVDAILGVDWSILYNLMQVGVSLQDLSPPFILRSSELWVFCSHLAKLTASDKNAIRQRFENLRRSGQIDQVLSRYNL